MAIDDVDTPVGGDQLGPTGEPLVADGGVDGVRIDDADQGDSDVSLRDRAFVRKQWRDSVQYARYRRFRFWVCVLFPIVVVLAMVGGAGWDFYKTGDLLGSTTASFGPPNFFVAGLVSAFAYLYFGASAVLFYWRQQRRELRDDLLLGVARSHLNAAEEAAVGEGAQVDFSNLWLVTQKRLDYYHTIATTQARESFRNAQIAAGAGFLTLVVSAVIAGAATSTSASIVAGATGMFGGALGAYLGATFVKMQQEASARLRAYFLQPLEFSRALAAERLTNSLEGDAKNSAILRIVDAIVRPDDGETVKTLSGI